MMKNISLKHRLILPIALLGIVALCSNLLSIINIHNVNANASNIADNYMDGKSRLAEISQSSMNIHKMALSHIVATDYNTMILLVRQIKEEEALLDQMLAEYQHYVTSNETAHYESLRSNYSSFQHALVRLVCASASHKTQEAYALANNEVASFATAMEADMDALNASINEQTLAARERLSAAYLVSLAVGFGVAIACILLVFAALRLIINYVVNPLKSILKTIQASSGRINHLTGEVLKRTDASRKSAAGLSSLSRQLSATIQEVAGNISSINDNTKGIQRDTHNMAEECSAITAYSVQMNARASDMQQSAKSNAEVTGAKAEAILHSLNQAIEGSKSVKQIHALTSEILSIAQQTRLISLNASVEAANAGEAGRGFAIVAREIRELADSSEAAANRIQAVNSIVTSAVSNLSENAQHLVDYMSQSVLTEFQAFVQSGSQYKEDAAFIYQAMGEFNQRTNRLERSMSEIAGSISTITNAIDQGAGKIAGVAGNAESLAADMEDITCRMGINQEVVAELGKETVAFDNL